MTEKMPSAPFASGNPPAIGTPGMSPPLTSSTRSAAGARSRKVTSRLAAMSGDTTAGGGAGGAAGCASIGSAKASKPDAHADNTSRGLLLIGVSPLIDLVT